MSHSSKWANTYKDDIHHQTDTVIRYAREDSAIVEKAKRIRRLSDKLINVLTDNPSLSTQAVNEWNVTTWREWYEELARVTSELKAATAADETLLENSVWFLCRTIDDLLFWMEYPERNESTETTVEGVEVVYSQRLVGNRIDDPSSPMTAREIAVYVWGRTDDAGRKLAREWMQSGKLPANLADGLKDHYVVSQSALEIQKEIASKVSDG